MSLVLSGRILTPAGVVDPGVVSIKDGKIDWVGRSDEYIGPSPWNLGQGLLVPGFIDLHVHGAVGAEFLGGNAVDLERILTYHGRHGTTGLLATIPAAPYEETIASLDVIENWMIKQGTPKDCAQILGTHLEGPFLSPEQIGGQDALSIRLPDQTEFDEWKTITSVRLVSVAPELPGTEDFIRHVRNRNVIVAAGHTAATSEELECATKWGLTHFTHFFNAMSGFHHREPGVVGAGLVLSGLTLELIADLIHVHPQALRLAYIAKGPAHIALVTDAVSFCGLEDGVYEKRGRKVHVSKGTIYLPGGVLAGSTLTLDRAVKNMVTRVGVSVEDAITMASTTPARILGLQDRKGSIMPGFDADLVFLDPSLNVRMSIVCGKIIHEASEANGQ